MFAGSKIVLATLTTRTCSYIHIHVLKYLDFIELLEITDMCIAILLIFVCPCANVALDWTVLSSVTKDGFISPSQVPLPLLFIPLTVYHGMFVRWGMPQHASRGPRKTPE